MEKEEEEVEEEEVVVEEEVVEVEVGYEKEYKCFREIIRQE